jgi:hypothetical protein
MALWEDKITPASPWKVKTCYKNPNSLIGSNRTHSECNLKLYIIKYTCLLAE